MPVALALLLIGCASAHESGAATIQAEEAPCRDDGDCAFTRVAQGACCPMLCTPRAVTRGQAEALAATVPRCTKGRNCPEPFCRPPPNEIVPACVQNRCVIRAGAPPD